MLIGTRQQVSKVNLDTLTVGDTSVATVNKAGNLVVLFRESLLPRPENGPRTQA